MDSLFDESGETNQLNLGALTEVGDLGGRVMDQEGHPVAGAYVTIAHEEGRSSGTERVGPDGAFVFRGVRVGEAEVSVRHPGFALERFRGNIGGHEAYEIVLSKEKTVWLQLKQSAAEVMGDPALNVWIDDYPLDTVAFRAGAKGVPNLPRRDVILHWAIGGFEGDISIPAEVETGEIQIPACGPMMLHLFRKDADPTEFFRLHFYEEGREGDPLFSVGFSIPSQRQGVDHLVSIVHPGVYRIVLESWTRDQEVNYWRRGGFFPTR